MTEVPFLQTRDALLARAQAVAGAEPSFARFLAATTLATDPEDLAASSPAVLEALWRQSYDRLGRRDPEPHKVFFAPPVDRGHPEIIEVFSADMPFIVDSVLAAVRARGGTVRFMAHPVLVYDPATNRVTDRKAPGAREESFLHIQIDPLPDEATRAAMREEIDAVMAEVALAVAGWRPMLERVQGIIRSWHESPPEASPATIAEAMHFLGWLCDHNFTFLGMREYELVGDDSSARLTPIEESGLGILRDWTVKVLRSGAEYVEMAPQHTEFLRSPEPLLVTKASRRARVHRRAHMDYVGIKLYDESGNVSGELRIVGLFTSMALAQPPGEVPLIRQKIDEVMRRAGHAPDSHAGKALMTALTTYPRDELFQIDQDRLAAFATAIARLGDRPRIRVLPRIDRFDTFVSILLFMPRERYDSSVRERIGAYLAEVYDGRVSAYYPSFPEGELARIHFIIGRDGGRTPRPDTSELEDEIAELMLSFGDRLRRASGEPETVVAFVDAFSSAYQSRNAPQEALADIGVLRELPASGGLALRFTGEGMRLKVYHSGEPVPLSDRVPTLENFGFRVIDERTYTVKPAGGPDCFIHDMLLEAASDLNLGGDDRKQRLEAAILAVWGGEAESDALNQLTTKVGLPWHDVAILRALTRYLRQIGIPFTRSYLNAVLAGHPEVGNWLVALFHAHHDPHYPTSRERALQAARDALATALDATTSLDEDRIIRRYINLAEAVTRTNAYQRDSAGDRRPALALKFDGARIEGLPAPRPYREIFVYSPRVEGVHLRFGAIARGGIRWSERPEDFRTEVLGLVKAQQVKNAIIVPVGAKGAFVPRQMPSGVDREAVQREATECYKIFISTLLDVTDNLEGDMVMPPPDVRRRDGDDPYLVVAADKGTARFSDTANAIAVSRGFWLGDAFASGGSAGYDHKKMGITARGAWEAVKRHFRELDRDIQTEPFTAVGVGDMSGDVFGNGMLLSPQTRLVAAFDHRDIFIDPDPDPVRSLTERARLFGLPRSSWQDYDRSIISKGGGVQSRSLKTVPLSAEARELLGLDSAEVTPAEVIRAILKAEVDLLWFGGIGTYVRAADETDAEVGDKANDALRVAGRDIRARVVGEGANLGVTQRGRIEYALAGGRINTDAIDNSAGVNSSDLEVNIKIALGDLTRSGELTDTARNELLTAMTEDVAALCLRNNYLQPLALSVAEYRGVAELPDHMALMETLEDRGLLDRDIEFLPSDAVLAERQAAGRGLTRPELAVLLAYAKNVLYADLLDSDVTDDAYLSRELYRYFPTQLIEKFRPAVSGHRLRREVVATVLANAMLNRGGPAFVSEITAATSADAGQVAAAYAATRDSFGLTSINAAIDALDNAVPGRTQVALYAEVEALLVRQTLWFVRNEQVESGLATLVDRYRDAIGRLRQRFGDIVTPRMAEAIAAEAARHEAAGVPAELARTIAQLSPLAMACDICLVASRQSADITETARAFFGVVDLFRLGAIIEAGHRIVLADRFDRLALDRAMANLMRAVRDLTADVLQAGDGDIAARLAAWQAAQERLIARTAEAVADLTVGEITVSRLSVAAGLLADLASSA